MSFSKRNTHVGHHHRKKLAGLSILNYDVIHIWEPRCRHFTLTFFLCSLLSLFGSQSHLYAQDPETEDQSSHPIDDLQGKSQRFGFLYLDPQDHPRDLDQELKSASRAGYKFVVIVHPYHSPQRGFTANDLRDKHPDLVLCDSLQFPVDSQIPENSLITLFPAEDHSFDKLYSMAEHIQKLESASNLSLQSLSETISIHFSDLTQPPIVIISPQTWLGGSSFEIIQLVEELNDKDLTPLGFPVLPELKTQYNVEQWESMIEVRENAWNQLLGVNEFQSYSAFSLYPISSNSQASETSIQTKVQLVESTSKDFLNSLREGNFFVTTNNAVTDLTLSIEASGFQEPLGVGSRITLPRGKRIQIHLKCDVPELDSLNQKNWLNLLEIVVISNSESQRLSETGIFVGRVKKSWSFVVPDDGFSIRGCVYREENGKRIASAFTNPLIIQTPPASNSVSISDVVPIVTLINTSKVLLGILALCLAIKWWGSFRKNRRPEILPRQKIDPAQFSKKPVPKEIEIENVDWSPPQRISASSQTPASTLQEKRQFFAADDLFTRKQLLVSACVLTVLIVYGLFVPLRYRPIEMNDAVEKFAKVPYLNIGLYGRQDWVANLLLFIPLGFLYCGSIFLDRKNILMTRSLAFSSVSIGLIGLAVATEFLQLWFPPRTVSQNDIIAESIGGVLGAVMAVLFLQRSIDWSRKLIVKSSLNGVMDWGLMIYAGLLLVATLMPFDFVVDANELKEKINKGMVDLTLLPDGKKELLSMAINAAVYLPIGVICYRSSKKTFGSRLPVSGILCFSLPFLFEMIQLPVFSRRFAIQNIIGGTTGVACGALICRNYSDKIVKYFTEDRDNRTLRSWLNILFCLTYLGMMFQFYRGDAVRVTDGETMNRLNNYWQVPFARLYWGSELNAFFVIVRQLLMMLPVGFLLADAMISFGVKKQLWRRLIVITVLFSSIAAFFEIAQAWSQDHFADVTDSLILICGGTLGLILRALIYDLGNFRDHENWQRTVTLNRIILCAFVAIISLLSTGYSSLYIINRSTRQLLSDENRIQLVIDSEATSQRLNVQNLVVPTGDHNEAIWGATGLDRIGNLWIGVSDGRATHASARILKLEPSLGRMTEVSDILKELKKVNLYKPGMSQSKIHSKFIQASDGWVYFSSMDEQGEKSDGSQLPTWGSHLWRIHPETDQIEHLATVPEGLIALSGGGQWIYSLGLFDHVLYQWNLETKRLKKVTVGSLGGHISRNFICDSRGHAFVPRLRKSQTSRLLPEESSSSSDATIAELVEFDTNLREISRVSLDHYLTRNFWTNHGITGICRLSNNTHFFTTSTGRLYRILSPNDSAKAIVQDLGWLHPDGSSYAPSLFELNEKIIGGIVSVKGKYEWVEREFDTLKSTSHDFPFPDKVIDIKSALLYGSQSKDKFGGAYIVGRVYGTPLLMRVTRK